MPASYLKENPKVGQIFDSHPDVALKRFIAII